MAKSIGINDSFMHVFLDDSVNKTKKSRHVTAVLQKLVSGQLKIFIDPDQCFQYVNDQQTPQIKILIVTNKLGKSLVPRVHSSSAIEKVYIYCYDKKDAEEWSKSFEKIKGIFTKSQDLLEQISKDVTEYWSNTQLPMSIFHLNEKQRSLKDLSKESSTFMWHRSIITVIRLMAKCGNSKEEMVEECRKYYQNDIPGMKKIDAFEKDYESSKAFSWYSASGFVSILLNEALRTQNFEIIFKFRLFINDLHSQIEKLYQENLNENPSNQTKNLTLYRGQQLGIEEINLLKNNINSLVSMNSFLSTTDDRQVAELFSGISNPTSDSTSSESVLFIIEVCDIDKDTTPFASIKNYSCIRDENEVVFSIGAIFRVADVVQSGHRWDVHLKLTKDDNQFGQNLYRFMMKEIGQEPDSSSFGWFLYRMGEVDKARRYCELIVKQIPNNNSDVAQAYNLLGLISKNCGQTNSAIEYYNKTLDICSQGGSCNSPGLVTIHYNLGIAYLAMGMERNADDHRRQADEKLRNFNLDKWPLLVAARDTLVAKIQMFHRDYKDGYETFQKILKLKRSILPEQHPSIASTLTDMGIAQENLKNYKVALSHFKEALDIGLKSLVPTQFDLVDYQMNVGRIQFKLEEYELALEQFEAIGNFYNDDDRDKEDRIAELKKWIEDTKEKLR